MDNFKTNNPVEHSLFKEYASGIDQSYWGAEFRHDELAWRNFDSFARARSLELLQDSTNDLLISVYGPQNMLAAIPGRIGALFGITSGADTICQGINMGAIVNETIMIRQVGPQVVNEAGFIALFGRPYDPTLSRLVQ